jgi:uncharacterized protein with GYD domain
MKSNVVRICLAFLLFIAMAIGQQRSSATNATQASSSSAMSPGGQPGTMMLTIFLRHDESKTLDEINAHLKQTGFDKNFPPPGVEVVSWYVMMGVGQVVTLRFPPDKLREVNLTIEHGAWGGFRTEFYPAYDYKPIWEAQQKQSGK